MGTVEWAEEREKIDLMNPVTLVAIVSCIMMIALLVYLIRSTYSRKCVL